MEGRPGSGEGRTTDCRKLAPVDRQVRGVVREERTAEGGEWRMTPKFSIIFADLWLGCVC